jgi:hypothetical protein
MLNEMQLKRFTRAVKINFKLAYFLVKIDALQNQTLGKCLLIIWHILKQGTLRG